MMFFSPARVLTASQMLTLQTTRVLTAFQIFTSGERNSMPPQKKTRQPCRPRQQRQVRVALLAAGRALAALLGDAGLATAGAGADAAQARRRASRVILGMQHLSRCTRYSTNIRTCVPLHAQHVRQMSTIFRQQVCYLFSNVMVLPGVSSHWRLVRQDNWPAHLNLNSSVFSGTCSEKTLVKETFNSCNLLPSSVQRYP